MKAPRDSGGHREVLDVWKTSVRALLSPYLTFVYRSHYVLTFKHLTLHISQLHHSIIIADDCADENGSPWQL